MATRNQLEGMPTNLSNTDMYEASCNNIQNWTGAVVPFPTETHVKGEGGHQQHQSFFGFIQSLWRGSSAPHVAASSIPDRDDKKAEVASQVDTHELSMDNTPEKRAR
ncbi:MAG: hypothetical protein JSS50_01010 [Proteobacteria bacterium]|nr:hypothetical protein [Pseudomonadota bacterium]